MNTHWTQGPSVCTVHIWSVFVSICAPVYTMLYTIDCVRHFYAKRTLMNSRAQRSPTVSRSVVVCSNRSHLEWLLIDRNIVASRSSLVVDGSDAEFERQGNKSRWCPWLPLHSQFLGPRFNPCSSSRAPQCSHLRSGTYVVVCYR